ncbi:MAG: DUF255 domain-containing protein [Pseudomonadota bacterium]
MKSLLMGSVAALAIGVSGAITAAPVAGPGASTFPGPVLQRLLAAREARGNDHVVRTEHIGPNGEPEFINRLIEEDSPYLLQHAHNPINWFSWSDEAFETARRLNRPILISIGYSTCHWCHVMERESFDNVDVAKEVNSRLIAIKVDRERRPDIDAVFIRASQLISGRAGWPVTVFATPDGAPFYAGSYLPRESFINLTKRASSLWRDEPGELKKFSAQVQEILAEVASGSEDAIPITAEVQREASKALKAEEDSVHGGFGTQQKFPHEPRLLLLLDWAYEATSSAQNELLFRALDVIERGGIHDHVGGGFHRYTVDRRWSTPHFEKMLYNQALLGRIYAEAYALTNKPTYARTARRVFDYVLRDMQSPEGLFFSATDADSEGSEGTFFVWQREEFDELFGSDAPSVASALGVTTPGRVHNANHLTRTEPASAELDRALERLRVVREKREKPLRDDKIIASWNALMVSALVRAAGALGEVDYRRAAERAAESLWARHYAGDVWWRTSLYGRTSARGTLSDYAYTVLAWLDLYDATTHPKWLDRATQLGDVMIERFWDKEAAGFFINEAAGNANLALRPKDSHDGAEPAANGVAALALARLHKRRANELLRDRAQATVDYFSAQIAAQPSAYPTLLRAAAELGRGQIGSVAYAARGAARVTLTPRREGGQAIRDTAQAMLTIDLAPGWHINTDKPLESHLIPTSVAAAGDVWQLDKVDFPNGIRRVLGFQSNELALFEGAVQISVTLRRASLGASSPLTMELHLQACNDEYCLLPETVHLESGVAYGSSP